MPMTDPVLTRRIPTPPWGEASERKLVDYDAYVKSGGYTTLAALTFRKVFAAGSSHFGVSDCEW